MSLRFRQAIALGLLLGSAGTPALAADAVTQLTLGTTVRPRTSLRVSSHVLVFEVDSERETATASITYSAGARARGDAEVVLLVETLSVSGPGGAADVEATVHLLDGRLSGGSPIVAARWTGSGLREGALTFALTAPAPGIYIVPVRVVITSP